MDMWSPGSTSYLFKAFLLAAISIAVALAMPLVALVATAGSTEAGQQSPPPRPARAAAARTALMSQPTVQVPGFEVVAGEGGCRQAEAVRFEGLSVMPTGFVMPQPVLIAGEDPRINETTWLAIGTVCADGPSEIVYGGFSSGRLSGLGRFDPNRVALPTQARPVDIQRLPGSRLVVTAEDELGLKQLWLVTADGLVAAVAPEDLELPAGALAHEAVVGGFAPRGLWPIGTYEDSAVVAGFGLVQPIRTEGPLQVEPAPACPAAAPIMLASPDGWYRVEVIPDAYDVADALVDGTSVVLLVRCGPRYDLVIAELGVDEGFTIQQRIPVGELGSDSAVLAWSSRTVVDVVARNPESNRRVDLVTQEVLSTPATPLLGGGPRRRSAIDYRHIVDSRPGTESCVPGGTDAHALVREADGQVVPATPVGMDFARFVTELSPDDLALMRDECLFAGYWVVRVDGSGVVSDWVTVTPPAFDWFTLFKRPPTGYEDLGSGQYRVWFWIGGRYESSVVDAASRPGFACLVEASCPQADRAERFDDCVDLPELDTVALSLEVPPEVPLNVPRTFQALRNYDDGAFASAWGLTTIFDGEHVTVFGFNSDGDFIGADLANVDYVTSRSPTSFIEVTIQGDNVLCAPR